MIVSTDANATLTFKAVGDDAMLNANISESAYIGSPANGFKTVSYEDDLVYIANGTSTQTIKRIPAITFAGSNLWATYYSTENLKVPDGLTAYTVEDVNEETGVVIASTIGYIPRYEAVLLKRTNTAVSEYTATTYDDDEEEDDIINLLEGTNQATSIGDILRDYTTDASVYVLYNDEFVKATTGTIPANRGYLRFGELAVAPRLTIEIEGDATGIDTVRGSEVMDNDYYDLSGRRVDQPTKGIYIVGGKKVVK